MLRSFAVRLLPLLLAGSVLPVWQGPADAAIYTWVGRSGSRDWATANNWTPAGVPGPEDTVTLDNGKTISLPSSISIWGLNLVRGTLQGATLKVTGSAVWTGGQITSELTVTPPAVLNITGDSSKMLNRTKLINQGTVIWSGGGSLDLSNGSVIDNQGLFEIRTDAAFAKTAGDRASFQNSGILRRVPGGGSTNFTGSIELVNSGTVEVQPGAVVAITAGSHTFPDGGRYAGEGTFQITGGTVILTGVLRTGGNFELLGGTLSGEGVLDGRMRWRGGQINGKLTIHQTSQLTLGGDGVKSLRGGTLENAGEVVWTDTGPLEGTSGARFNNQGLLDLQSDAALKQGSGAPAALVNTGTLRKTGTLGVDTTVTGFQLRNWGLIDIQAGRIRITSGVHTLDEGTRIQGSGALVLAGRTADPATELHLPGLITVDGTLEVESGVVKGVLAPDATGAIRGSGVVRWLGGNMTGNIAFAQDSRLEITGGDMKTWVGGFHQLGGTVIWTGAGTLAGSSGAVIRNSGLFEARNDAPLSHRSGTATNFNNEGTFLKSATSGTGATTLGTSLRFSNQGTLEVREGIVAISAGTHTLAEGSRITGAGTVQVTGGVLDLRGAAKVEGNLVIGGGSVTGEGSLVGKTRWAAGVLKGKLIIPEGSELLLEGAENKLMSAATLENRGTVTITGEGYLSAGDGSTVDNYGLITAPGDANLTNVTEREATWNNYGTIALSGTLRGSVVNHGLLKPAVPGGALTIRGSYRQSPQGRLDVTVGGTEPAMGFSQVAVTGDAALDGRLSVLHGKDAAPQPTERFSVLRYGSLSGLFLDIDGNALGPVRELRPEYGRRELALLVVDLPTDGSAWVDLIGRGNFRGGTNEYVAYYGNKGPTDIHDLVLLFQAPAGSRLRVVRSAWPSLRPPAGSIYEAPGYLTNPQSVLPVYIHKLPAGYTGALYLSVTPQGVPLGRATVSATLLRAPESQLSQTGSGKSAVLSLVAERMAEEYVRLGGRVPSAPGSPDNALQRRLDAQRFFEEKLHAEDGAALYTLPPDASENALSEGVFLDVAAAGAWAAAPPVSGDPGDLGLQSAIADLGASARFAKTRAGRDMDARPDSEPLEAAGPLGVGEARNTSTDRPIGYGVFLENPATASAPIAEAAVTVALDLSKFDPDTFGFGPISVAGRTVLPVPGAAAIGADVDLRPFRDVVVRLSGTYNREQGTVTWRFFSLDPVTLQPVASPAQGFLVPNANSPEGQSAVSFHILPRPGVPSGTELQHLAQVSLNGAAPVTTNLWTNLAENTPPTSRVLPLAGNVTNNFEVKWSGEDAASGIAGYTIYVSDNGGPFTRWLTSVTETSAIYPGETGHTYSFYSVARDQAGNVELKPAAAEAITTTEGPKFVLGDADSNERVDVRDVIFILRSLAGQVELNPLQRRAADVSGDGLVNVVDAVYLLRGVAGLPL